jgi:hypothetical protein
MKIGDVLQRDPAVYALPNDGQARITEGASEKEVRQLRDELSTFVCKGQFKDGMATILSSYVASLGQTNQKAAWVSGFFGSGKSHFLKMLGHLWQDTEFPDGATARSIVPALPDDVRDLLRELDTAGKRAGGLLAATGALPSGTTDNVRLTVLGILLRSVGLPAQYSQADFCLWLYDQGYYPRVKAAVEASGKNWEAELNNLYVSGPIAQAVLKCDKNYAGDEKEARKTIKDQHPPRLTDVNTADFLRMAKRALRFRGRDGRPPCTVLVLDEVQQYIGQSNDRSTLVTEVVEAVSKQLDSQVMVVGAGQSALTDVPLLHKLMDRFRIRVPLSDTDVESVTREVLLQKKPACVGDVRSTLDAYAGEVSRELQGTRIGETAEDRTIVVEDYPLLPVRRRFWEACFRQVDLEGTHSQLRSQLCIIHDAVAKISKEPLRYVIPADELFEALAPEMVNTGVLLREINERIINLSKDGTPQGKLGRRICGLVFLIGKLPRKEGVDIGVRASKEHIADLLVEDLGGDNAKLRNEVEKALEKLASEGVLMKVGDEYRLQTKEGSEWDREFRNRQTKIGGEDGTVQLKRDGFLYAAADEIVRSLKLSQGAAKEPRGLSVYRDQTPPPPPTDSIQVWIRDGWSCSEKEVTDAARAAGGDNPVIYVFIPRQSADDLRKWIVEAEAAQQTLDYKGTPSSEEGQEARRGMESRRDNAAANRQGLINEIVANAKVFQGGGAELLNPNLKEKLDEGAKASLARLFPQFNEADAPGSAWEMAIKRARDGADQPFQPIGYTGSTEQHPVCQQVKSTIGAGKAGNEIRKALQASPFGWPQDAIDAALIALHRMQHISATLNGVPVSLGQLDQNKISKAQFRVEQTVLSVGDRLRLRKLFTSLKIQCKGGEEAIKAPEFLAELSILAAAAGGPPPLPAPPATAEIDDLKRLVGGEQLAAIRSKADDLEKRINEWTKLKELAEKRKPVWETAERMAKHGGSLPTATEQIAQMDAVRRERMLLAPVDPVSAIRGTLADLLRKAINDAHAEHESAYKTAMDALAKNSTWQQVPTNKQAEIVAEAGLLMPKKSDISSDEALLASLDSRSLGARQAEALAVTGRVQKALELAAKYLEPKVKVVNIERATLRSKDDLDKWLERTGKTLSEAVKQGPVLVN